MELLGCEGDVFSTPTLYTGRNVLKHRNKLDFFYNLFLLYTITFAQGARRIKKACIQREKNWKCKHVYKLSLA